MDALDTMVLIQHPGHDAVCAEDELMRISEETENSSGSTQHNHDVNLSRVAMLVKKE